MDQKEIFKSFGEATTRSVANVSDWKQALLYIERQDKSVGFKSSYLNSSGEEIRVDTEADYFTSKAVKELYAITSKHPLDHSDWNKAVFKISPDNKFSIDYIWDQDWQDEIDSYSA